VLSAKAAEEASRAPISRACRVLAVVMVWVLRVAFRVVTTLRESLPGLVDL
jgi:hypothetical protein